MNANHNYNFENLVQLCRDHYPDIKERKELSYLLQNKKVRYIDPEGHFGYTTFGNFYFDTRKVMMLVTKEFPIARYHQPGSMQDTLWSTVPVLFAGIETGMRDSKGKEIYSCDVLSVSSPVNCEGVVIWFDGENIPCVRLDNHCFYFNEIKQCEIIGNVFFDIEELDYEYYHFEKFYGNNPFFQGPVENKYWVERIEKIKNAPSFIDGKPQPKERYHRVYMNSIAEIGISRDDVLVAFSEDHEYDPNDEMTYPTLYIDNGVLPENVENRCEDIPIDIENPNWEKIEKRAHEIMLEAHRFPNRKYFLCNMRESVPNKKIRDGIGRIFKEVSEYQICNFIMPFEIAIY